MPNIEYSVNKSELDSIGIESGSFFEGWPKKPNEEVMRKSIMDADYAVLAIDRKESRLIGYITAVSDNVLSAYIPFLEVVAKYQKQGIGHTLVNSVKMSRTLRMTPE